VKQNGDLTPMAIRQVATLSSKVSANPHIWLPTFMFKPTYRIKLVVSNIIFHKSSPMMMTFDDFCGDNINSYQFSICPVNLLSEEARDKASIETPPFTLWL